MSRIRQNQQGTCVLVEEDLALRPFGQDYPDSKRLRSQIYPALICVSLFVIFAAKFIYDGRRSQGRHLEYHLIWLANNYFQFGAMRRALVGSVIYVSGVDLVTAAYLLYGISFFLVLLFAYVFLRRITQAGGALLPFALILGALLLFWSEEVGQTDILVAAILLAAALALIDGRVVLASLCLAIGFQIHEVTAIYGLPLAAALLLQGSRYKKYQSTTGAIAASILIGGILFYVALWFLPRASDNFVAETIRSRLPVNYPFDSFKSKFATFIILGGIRAEVDSMCLVTHSVHHYIKPFIALLMVALAGASMSEGTSEGTRLRWALAVIATVPPIVFLWLTAIDMGRWAALAILNVWILCASSDFEPVTGVKRWAWVRAAGAAAMVPLLFPLTIPVHFFGAYPSPLIEGGIEKVIGHPAIRTFDECDPTWRASLS
jgi:hypothetical protein